jgi:hypothetical protein
LRIESGRDVSCCPEQKGRRKARHLRADSTGCGGWQPTLSAAGGRQLEHASLRPPDVNRLTGLGCSSRIGSRRSDSLSLFGSRNDSVPVQLTT